MTTSKNAPRKKAQPAPPQDWDGTTVELVRSRRNQQMGLMPTETILDARMSPTALGILTYLVAVNQHPDFDLTISAESIAKNLAETTLTQVKVDLVELEDLGYVTVTEIKGARGDMPSHALVARDFRQKGQQ